MTSRPRALTCPSAPYIKRAVTHTGTGVNASIGDEMTARAFTCTDVSPALHARVSRKHVRRIPFAHEVHDVEAIQ